MRNAGIKDMTEGVKVGGRNVNNLRYADDTTLLAEMAPDLKDKRRDKSITVETKVRLVCALVFSVVPYGSESWMTKKSDDKKINSFELWCWRRLLRVPWTARRRNEWVLQQVGNPESLESTMVRIRLKYYGHCNRKDGSLEKDLMMGLTVGRRKRGRPPRR